MKASDSESKSDSARRQWFGKHDRPSRDLDNGQTEAREFSGNGRLRKPSRGCAIPFSTLDILDRRRPSSALWHSWLQIPTSPSLWLHYRPRFCFKGPQTFVVHRDPDTVSSKSLARDVRQHLHRPSPALPTILGPLCASKLKNKHHWLAVLRDKRERATQDPPCRVPDVMSSLVLCLASLAKTVEPARTFCSWEELL